MYQSKTVPRQFSRGGFFQFPVCAQDGIVMLREAHTRSALSLSSHLKVVLEAVPMLSV